MRPLVAAGALAVTLGLSACSGDPSPSPGAVDGGGDVIAADIALDCVTSGYPCSWSEVDDEAVERTDVLLQLGAALIGAGDSIADVAARIGDADGVVNVSFDELGIMFRVEGGIPVTIDVDPTGTGQVLSGPTAAAPGDRLPSLAKAQGVPFTGCGPGGRDAADLVAGVAKAPDEPRHALVLSPYQFELNWEFRPIVANLRHEDSVSSSMYQEKHGGSITEYITWVDDQPVTQGTGDNVIPEHFCGWEKYDTILLMTHGRALCGATDADGKLGCLTFFSVGRYDETPAELRELVGQARGITVGTSTYAGFLDSLTPAQKAACYARFEELIKPAGTNEACLNALPTPKYAVTVSTDFFAHNYPEGLPDRLIFLAACQGLKHHALGNTQGDMAAILGRGGAGYIVGFDKLSLTGLAEELMERFTLLIGYGHRITDRFVDNANEYLDDESAHPDFVGVAIGELDDGELGDLVGATRAPTWGQDAVRIRSGGSFLIDEGVVQLAEPQPRSDVSSLDLTLVLTDVEDGESPDDFNVAVFFEDTRLDLGDLEWRAGDHRAYTADAVVDLPRQLDGFEWFDLRIEAELPAVDGAPTVVTYDDVTAGETSLCDRLSAAAVTGAIGVAVNPVDTGGFGDIFGGTCAWATPDEVSGVQILVQEGAGDEFRAGWSGDGYEVDGFGDLAVYDPYTGQGDDCPRTVGGGGAGRGEWACFVNLTVAVGGDTLYITLDGDVVGNSGPEGSLDVLRRLVEVIRST